jgi:hypothetical protein
METLTSSLLPNTEAEFVIPISADEHGAFDQSSEDQEFSEVLDPWLQWLSTAGLYTTLHGPTTTCQDFHSGITAIFFFALGSLDLTLFLTSTSPDVVAMRSSQIGKISYTMSTLFSFTLGFVYLACVFFFRSEQRMKATFTILFQDNPLMRQPRLDFAIALRNRYMPRLKMFCVCWMLFVVILMISSIIQQSLDVKTVLSDLTEIPFLYLAYVMVVTLTVPFFTTIVHRFAMEYMHLIITDPITFAKCQPDMQDRIVKQPIDAAAFECGSVTDLVAVDSGYVVSSDGKFACVDELHYMLIMIRRHRQMLAEACTAQMWLLTSLFSSLSFVTVAFLSIFVVSIMHWPNISGSLFTGFVINFGLFGTILFGLLAGFLFCVAYVSHVHMQCTEAVMSSGCGALMRTAKQHAWQMQLLISTLNADNFKVFGISINFALVSRLGYFVILAIAYLISSGIY